MPFLFRRFTKLQIAVVSLLTLAGISAFAFGVRAWRSPVAENATSPAPQVIQAAVTGDIPLERAYVKRVRLWPQLQETLQVLGDRLEKPGKERTIVIGTLVRSVNATTEFPVRLIYEMPNKFRLDEQKAGKTEVTVYDGKDAKKADGDLKKDEEEALETLLFDSLEQFLIGRQLGSNLRYLGSGFRTDDGRAANYTGPLYDVYRTVETISLKKDISRQQIKTYFINPKTKLLERITYSPADSGGSRRVEVRLSGWRSVNGQQFPTEIVRLDDGKSALKLTLNTVTVAAKADDGIFTIPTK